jgi:hypothetical protein
MMPTADTEPFEACPWGEDTQRPTVTKDAKMKKGIFFINIVLAPFYHG